MTEYDLLAACVQHTDSHLGHAADQALRQWWNSQRQRSWADAANLLGVPETKWNSAIADHRAHRHAVYTWLAHQATVAEFALFMAEARSLPSFLLLLQRTLDAQICSEGRVAVLRNLEDEHIPAPHYELMRRLVHALQSKAGDQPQVDPCSSLMDRRLTSFYGYHCDVWHLVGSLYATEVMSRHRVEMMGIGLTRLGFRREEMEFVNVHLVCDEDHAQDWNTSVVVPSIFRDSSLRERIAEGAAACLESSARYLDDFSRRGHLHISL